MEIKEFDPVQTFDTKYTSQPLQLIKVLIPYLEPELRKTMIILIHFMELQYTINHIRSHPEDYADAASVFSLDENMEQIRKYCPPAFISMLDNLNSIQNAMKLYEEMKDMMEFTDPQQMDFTSFFQE
jgi:hypothetical protein